MKSIAETWKDGPFASSRGACSRVVLRHRALAAACACLTVDAAAVAAYCTLEGAAQIKPADGFLHSHCLNLTDFTKSFSNMVFYNCGLPFSHRKLFSTMCTTIRSYSVYKASTRNKEGIL